MKTKPNLPGRLLWEYDLETFNYDRSYKIVIERVLQLGKFVGVAGDSELLWRT